MKEKFCNSNTSGSSKVKSLHCNAHFLIPLCMKTIKNKNFLAIVTQRSRFAIYAICSSTEQQ